MKLFLQKDTTTQVCMKANGTSNEKPTKLKVAIVTSMLKERHTKFIFQ